MKQLPPKKAHSLFLFVLALAAVLLVCALVLHMTPLFWLSVLAAWAGIILHLVFYRCPHCKRHLGANPHSDFCPYCRKRLSR